MVRLPKRFVAWSDGLSLQGRFEKRWTVRRALRHDHHRVTDTGPVGITLHHPVALAGSAPLRFPPRPRLGGGEAFLPLPI